MASHFGYVTAEEVRGRCRQIDVDDMSDADIESKISRYEFIAHKKAARPTSDPWSEDEDDFALVQRLIIEGCAVDILGAFPEAADFVKIALSNYDDAVSDLTQEDGGTKPIITKTAGSSI